MITLNRSHLILFLFVLLPWTLTAQGDPDSYDADPDYAQVQGVRVVNRGNGTWDFHVTVRHNDEGWNHYADAWQILDEESGGMLAERILAHPHDDEKPFTRSLTGIEISEHVAVVRVNARCNVHGFGGRTVLIDLNALR